MTMQWPRRTCWRTRAVRVGTVAVGNATAGRVHRAFEDTGDGCGAEKGGDENGGAREGELADVRRRCRKRQHMSRRRIKRRRRCDKMQRINQPAKMKRGVRGWMREAAVRQKAMQGGGGVTRGDTILARKQRQREEMHQRTRGGGALMGRGCGGGRVERTRGGGVDF